MSPGLVIAAPASGSGKTVTTLGLLRALAASGVAVSSLKVGPDFIDPAFHAAATGRPVGNLDLWAMREATWAGQIAATADSELVVVEGVMGLFAGAGDQTGSTAEVAARTGWPVILVVDASGQAASVAALAEGFANHRSDVTVAGVILNQVAGDRHRDFLLDALEASNIRCFGSIGRSEALALPSRHLGLVQAQEREDLATWLDRAGAIVTEAVDLDALVAIAQPPATASVPVASDAIPALGARIAIATDQAFAFRYPHVEASWKAQGAALHYFSPLANEVPPADADAIYLPGGYPELHAGRLAAAEDFMNGLRGAAERDAPIYGECGGYMVLGEFLTDEHGRRHPMAGLLPVSTSFAERRLTLGYRQIELLADGPLGSAGARFRGHEFHYSIRLDEEAVEPLFEVHDAAGRSLPPAGSRRGSVFGSYVHLVDREAAPTSGS